MRIGVFVSNEGDHASRLGLSAMAVAAEEAGADGLWVSDHLLMLDEPTTEYPFSEDGVPPWDMAGDYYEALTCCAWIAASTRRCRVGTAVLVLPQRNVLEVAKAVATLDRLSSGRLALGVGAGWYGGEMEALGYGFRSRGRRFDEMLEVLRDCWTGRPAGYGGSEVSVREGVVLEPRPVHGGVPLLVGGMSALARRRAARHGDGWLAIAGSDDWDAEGLAAGLTDVRRRRGPQSDSFEAVLQLNADPQDPPRIIELVRQAGEIGFDEVIVEPPWTAGVDDAATVIAEVKASTAIDAL